MNLARPVEVMESVTMVVPGCSRSRMAAIMAMMRLRLSSLPSESTAPARSTSVSKMMPRSALFSSTADRMAAMAASFSGLGMWLGKVPSGSRNRDPVVSAPKGSSTWAA